MYIFLTNQIHDQRDLSTNFTPSNCLFGAVKLTKNPDSDKFKHTGYNTRFDSRSQFSWSEGNWGKNVIIFRDDMNLSMRVDYKKKFILVLGEQKAQMTLN